MTIIWAAVVILIGQILVAIALVRLTRSFGVYAERLMQTHHQNVQLRQNLATIEKELAMREMLHPNPPLGKEKVS